MEVVPKCPASMACTLCPASGHSGDCPDEVSVKCSFLRMNFFEVLRIQKCILVVIFAERKIPNSPMIFTHEFVTKHECGYRGRDVKMEKD